MITVTEEAARHLRDLLQEKRWDGYGLRFGVRDGGCSGYSYLLEFEPSPRDGDHVHEEHGIRVFIAPEHLPMVQGSTIRWKDELMETGLDIVNPNARRLCGCGTSFDV